MLKKWFLLLIPAILALVACQNPVYNQSEANVADIVLKARAARSKSNTDARQTPSVVVKKGMYVDTTPINLIRKPSWLKNHIIIRGDQLPFSYYSRIIAAGSGGNILTKYQPGLDSSKTTLSMNYSGTVKGALNLLASKTGFVYSINKDIIYWQAFITRTYDIAFMPGGTDYLMGKNSSGSNQTANTSSSGSNAQVSNYVSSDSSDDEYSNLKGTLSIWKDLTATLNELISPDGKVMVSEATTTVTVRDRPANVNLIGQYIHNLNSNLSKQVLVKIQILDVALENDWNQGIDWQIIAKAFHHSPFIINGNYGTPITISRILSPQSGVPGISSSIPGNNSAITPFYPRFGTISQDPGIPSYTILLNALSQQAKTSVVSEPRVLCLNNQVSVVRITRQQGYVASIQNTSLAGSATSISNNTVTSQVTPGTAITGLTLYILPKILNSKVYMQVNADLSTINNIDQFSGIQLPNITTKHFNQRSMLHSGDTLILAGFKQTSNTANANQFLSSQALGGQGAQMLNTETIVLITPIILTT